MVHWTPQLVAALVIALLPFVALAFAGERLATAAQRRPAATRLTLPAVAGVVYWLVVHGQPSFRWGWATLYVCLPVLVAVASWAASRSDPEQRGSCYDFAILLLLGLTVEFRVFERAWPPHLGGFNRLLLLDSGLYGFLVIRKLSNVGFYFVPRWKDFKTGLRELAFYAPIAVPLGLWLGFIHFHPWLPSLRKFGLTWISILLFVALLEETYFRGWWQNLLERRIGRTWSLLLTAALFGLSHFNKGETHFNWRYVLMATLAGIFYGRAWREDRRLMASAITHASVDTLWVLWFR